MSVNIMLFGASIIGRQAADLLYVGTFEQELETLEHEQMCDKVADWICSRLDAFCNEMEISSRLRIEVDMKARGEFRARWYALKREENA